MDKFKTLTFDSNAWKRIFFELAIELVLNFHDDIMFTTCPK